MNNLKKSLRNLSIPTLYDKLGTTKIGDLNNCIECLVEEERNGLFEVNLVCTNTEQIAQQLVEENIIICNANDTLLNQKFRIYQTRKLMSNRIEVFARHISFDLAYDCIDSIDISNQSCEYALNTIFRSSQFSRHYRGYSDIINAQDYKISMCNCLEAIAGKEGSIIDTFGTGAEILRDNTNIHVFTKRGHDNSVSIEYAKNLTGLELEEDTTDLVTRIIPFAKYTNEANEEILVKASAVDSLLINNYSHPYIRYIDYSDKFEDDNIPTTSKLETLARNEYKNNKVDISKHNFKIEFIPLSKCVGYENIQDKISLCDIVTIKDTRYFIETKAKVIRVIFNVLKNRYESMELGEPRTSLGDIIGGGGGSGEDGKPGPPGPPGPPGEDGNIGDFPDSLPAKSVLTGKSVGLASIELIWTFENKVYYSYELYASKTRDFNPNSFDLIFEGQASSYLFQAKPNETWYFRVCGINSYGNRNEFSDQIVVTTAKINGNDWIEKATIGNALIGELSADKITSGTISGHYIDARNLSVTDGNGKRTLDIDSFGNVNLDVTSLKISSKDVATNESVDNALKDNIISVDVMYYLSDSEKELIGGSWQTTAPAWEKDKYIWTKTVTTYKNGSQRESNATCISGADGLGIESIQEQYYLSTSRRELIGGSWQTTSPDAERFKYIWTRSKITYTDSTTYYTNPICVSGSDGTDGEDGADGTGLTSIDVEYAISASNTNAPTSGWETTAPKWEKGKYIWTRNKTTLSNGDTTYSKAVCISGADGDDGVGLANIQEQYYLSTSKVQQTGGSWLDSPPAWEKGKYMWTRSKITYTDDVVKYTDPIVDLSWEIVNDALQEALDSINKEIGDVDTAIKDLSSYIEEAYRDGILDEQEKEVLKQLAKSLEIEKVDVIAQVESIASAEELVSTSELTVLSSAKTNYLSSHSSLINEIIKITGGVR